MNEIKFWWVRILMSEPKTDDDKAIRMNKEQEKNNEIRARGMISGGFLLTVFVWFVLDVCLPVLKTRTFGGYKHADFTVVLA